MCMVHMCTCRSLSIFTELDNDNVQDSCLQTYFFWKVRKVVNSTLFMVVAKCLASPWRLQRHAQENIGQ